jgi:hypothetical protein
MHMELSPVRVDERPKRGFVPRDDDERDACPRGVDALWAGRVAVGGVSISAGALARRSGRDVARDRGVALDRDVDNGYPLPVANC